MKQLRLFILLLIALSTAIAGHGQQGAFSSYIKDGMYKFDDTLKLSRKTLFTTYRTQFDLGVYDSMLRLSTNTIDTLGGVQDRYLQLYKGYPVEPTMMNVISKYGVVTHVMGFKINNLSIDVSSPISEATALANALAVVDSPKYMWQDTALIDSMAAMYLQIGDTAKADSLLVHGFDPPKGTLVINVPFQDTNLHNPSHYALCWKFEIQTMAWDTITHVDTLVDSTNTVYEIDTNTFIGYRFGQRYVIYINANTGDFYSDYEHYFGGYELRDCKTPYNGTRAVQDHTSTPFDKRRLFDDHGVTGYWTDMGKGADVLSTRRKDNWNGTNAAAYWAIERSWDYYKYVHGQEGSNFKRWPVNVVTQFPDAGAFGYPINESDASFEPNLGGKFPGKDSADLIFIVPDHSGTYYSAAQLDVLGHELTHSYIYHNAHLDYGDEAFSLNEALSDFFGSVIYNWFQSAGTYGTPTSTGSMPYWGIGWNNNNFFRHFTNPHGDVPVASWDYYGDTYVTSPNPYQTGGCIRKFFSLLTDGGTHRSTTVPSLGINTVEQDAFVTMTWWLWSGSDLHFFKDAYLAWCEKRYTKCSASWKAARSGFNAVNLLPTPSCPLVLVGTPEVATHTEVALHKIKIFVIPGGDFGLTPISYSWQIPANWNVTYNNDHSEFTLNDVDGDYSSKYVKCIVTFPGGVIDSGIAALRFVDSSYFAARFASPYTTPNQNAEKITEAQIFPNPTTDIVNIFLPEQPVNTVMHLYDITGREMYSKSLTNARSTIYLPTLKVGAYLMRVIGDNVRVNKNIVIQR